MTRKNMTCIECPVGCSLCADIENCRLVQVSGNKCPKGEGYARSEVENPSRFLTSIAAARGLELKMVPVRTDKPIPKSRMMEAAAQIKKITIDRPVRAGEVLVKDLLGLGVDVVATRSVGKA
ncbi:MAG: DUF1667 domain-containing protein [Deltaproteobacteria bacterium]